MCWCACGCSDPDVLDTTYSVLVTLDRIRTLISLDLEWLRHCRWALPLASKWAFNVGTPHWDCKGNRQWRSTWWALSICMEHWAVFNIGFNIDIKHRLTELTFWWFDVGFQYRQSTSTSNIRIQICYSALAFLSIIRTAQSCNKPIWGLIVRVISWNIRLSS